MAEALDLNIPLGEGGADSVEKIIKPLLDLEKEKSPEESDNPFSIKKVVFSENDLKPVISSCLNFIYKFFSIIFLKVL